MLSREPQVVAVGIVTRNDHRNDGYFLLKRQQVTDNVRTNGNEENGDRARGWRPRAGVAGQNDDDNKASRNAQNARSGQRNRNKKSETTRDEQQKNGILTGNVT